MPLAVSPLWPAQLDHLAIESPNPEGLAAFYARALGMTVSPRAEGSWLAAAKERRFIICDGSLHGHPYSGFALAGAAQLESYRRFVTARGATLLAAPTPLLGEEAFAVRDPDGRLAVFGLGRGVPARPESAAAALPGRLQHVVVASSRFPEMMAFYRDVLGFLVSDTVHVANANGGLGDVNVCFLRSDEEHHSFAIFRAPKSSSDHFALEVESWDDIRRWADHFAALDVALWWGPGRHGAGNNLFFMVKDPDGNNIEISAELEHIPKGEPGKRWPAGGKALNLWGSVWVRDAL
jgi:catechol 2,3-dioxygenase-like lactoylglutathione lyase family enzyme